MMTVKQVSIITGVSVRTLQFYDEIGLLHPAALTEAGYRLYDQAALQTLHQILFLKKLEFTLKEIQEILLESQENQLQAYQKQRERLLHKRDQLSAVLNQLDILIKGEKHMETNQPDMSAYYDVLERFKETQPEAIIKQFGSLQKYEETIADIQSREANIKPMVIQIYGSVEAYAQSIEKNLAHFLTEGPPMTQQEAIEFAKQTDEITRRLTSNLAADPASSSVQAMIGELIAFSEANSPDLGSQYWSYMADNYESSPLYRQATDAKYGNGASQFISQALRVYLSQQ